ncbi:hypothetical protein OQY15_04690 [Pedobacter sp. MC2016-15]|uniref:hypothetical protein n=1 Tax=Pedobacter sp. MC2016-15 TaxID=2994473 RepID=UPI002247B9CB|nr:hypothetical protein [Pedobacter sp. MC2016-15]MCX2478375.1 hypothetical protein [Pedobacter sp. MC2016-15]
MEAVNSNIFCVLDACSVINLIHIDQDEFLLKKLKHLNIFVSDVVFKEIKFNIFNKLDKLKTKYSVDFDIRQERKIIDVKLSQIRGYQVLNEQIVKELGHDFFNHVKIISDYKKENGEFYSACLALYLTRYHPTKIFFHTDDFPAKNEFDKFFNYQQIGHIEDTSDLLLLLYRLDEKFSLKQLEIALTDLFSEYVSEVVELEKKLKYIESGLTLKFKGDKIFQQKFRALIHSLVVHNFLGIGELKDFFCNNKKYSQISDILDFYPKVFELESSKTDLLKKISDLKKNIKHVYKL